MPLSPPADRTHLHTREIECRGYARGDGLFDIEARIVDSKRYAHENGWRGELQPGEPVHHMEVRITVDGRLVIHGAEAATIASPFRICPEAAPNLARIAGIRIGPGWMKEVKARYGGAHGCTHILELLGQMATTAYQTIFAWKEHQARAAGADDAELARRGPRVDSCYAYGRGREAGRGLRVVAADGAAAE